MIHRILGVAFACLALWVCVTSASAQSPAIIDHRTVWKPTRSQWLATIDCQQAGVPYDACIYQKLRLGGASPQAIDFAKAMAASRNGLAYMTGLRRPLFGRVSPAFIVYPGRANTNGAVLLVNGIPSSIDAESASMSAAPAVAADARFRAIQLDHPRAALWATPSFDVERARPGGGQRFIFRAPILDGCHACAVVGTAEVGYDFDRAGIYRGVKLIAVREGTDAPIALRLRPNGFGQVHVGMSLAALRANGIAITSGTNGATARFTGHGCEYGSLMTMPAVAMMFTDGVVARFDIISPGIATDRGVAVGDRLSRVLKAYPNVKQTPNIYSHSAVDIEYMPPAPLQRYRFIFIVDRGHVQSMRSGRLPEVRYVEGCG